MDLNYTYKSDPESIIELICDMEINQIINSVNEELGCSLFAKLIKDMAKVSKDRRGNEKLKATNELKETFRKMLHCFPPELLEKHNVQVNVEFQIHNEIHMRERYPDHVHKKILTLPSNEEIEQLWKTKRQERRELQEQIIAGGSSLKRKELNGDVVEKICKKLKN